MNNEVFFTSLLKNTSDVVLLIDAKGQVCARSQTAVNIFGPSLADLILPVSNGELTLLVTHHSDKLITWTLEDIDHHHLLVGKVKTEAQLAMQALYDQAGFNVYWTDHNGVAMGTNPHALDVFQITNDEYRGLTYADIGKRYSLPMWTYEKFHQDDLSVIRTGKPIANEHEPVLILPDGSYCYFMSYRVPMRDDNNNVIGSAGLSVDITPTKLEKEKFEVSDKAKTNVLHHVAHDVCTPLTSMISLVELLIKNINLNCL